MLTVLASLDGLGERPRDALLLGGEVGEVVQALDELRDGLQERLVALVKVEDGSVTAAVREVGPDAGAGVNLIL